MDSIQITAASRHGCRSAQPCGPSGVVERSARRPAPSECTASSRRRGNGTPLQMQPPPAVDRIVFDSSQRHPSAVKTLAKTMHGARCTRLLLGTSGSRCPSTCGTSAPHWAHLCHTLRFWVELHSRSRSPNVRYAQHRLCSPDGWAPHAVMRCASAGTGEHAEQCDARPGAVRPVP